MNDPRIRAVLSLSGSMFANEDGTGVSPTRVREAADAIASARASPLLRLAVIVHGNNMWPLSSGSIFDQGTAARIRGIGSVFNAVAVQGELEQRGLSVRVSSAFPIPNLAESFARRRVLHQMNEGDLIIFAGGSALPLLSEESAAAHRALDIGATLVILGVRASKSEQANFLSAENLDLGLPPDQDMSVIRWDVTTSIEEPLERHSQSAPSPSHDCDALQ